MLYILWWKPQKDGKKCQNKLKAGDVKLIPIELIDLWAFDTCLRAIQIRKWFPTFPSLGSFKYREYNVKRVDNKIQIQKGEILRLILCLKHKKGN